MRRNMRSIIPYLRCRWRRSGKAALPRGGWPARAAYGTAVPLSATAETATPEEEPPSAERVPASLSVVSALVPLALAALVDPTAHPRESVLGLTLGADRGGAPPIPQLLVPLLTLVPLGPLEVRSAIALALPASIAALLLTRRAVRRPYGGGGFAARAIVIAFGAIGGALLAAVPPSAALTVIGLELALSAHVAAPARKAVMRGMAWAAIALAIWAAPRLSPALLLTGFLAARGTPFAVTSRKLLHFALPTLCGAAVVLLARDSASWLSLGKPFDDGVFVRATGELFPSAVALRTAVVAAVLTFGTILLGGFRESLDPDDRLALLACIAAFGSALILHAPGAANVSVVLLLPLCASTASALHIAVDRGIGVRRRPFQRAIAWLVPALSLGLAARAIEDDLRTRRRSPDAAAASELAPLVTVGTALPRGFLVMEEARVLIGWARHRAVLALRPDLSALPVQGLLLGGPARMATRVIEQTPKAADLVRGLLAHGTLEESDVSPLAQQHALLVQLPAARLRLLARHADPTGGPLRISVERVDPSERRAHRVSLDRRLRFIVDALASEPAEDPLRAALRTAATREARVLAAAGDREGAAAALVRSQALGADPQRVARWMARLRAKQSLDAEPSCEDD